MGRTGSGVVGSGLAAARDEKTRAMKKRRREGEGCMTGGGLVNGDGDSEVVRCDLVMVEGR